MNAAAAIAPAPEPEAITTRSNCDPTRRRFSRFNGVKDTTPSGTANLAEIIHEIRSGAHREQVEQIRALRAAGNENEADALKCTLPAMTPHGRFKVRNGDALEEASGLLCIDFDDIPGDLAIAQGMLEATPHTLATFCSPSGTGIKVFARHEGGAEQHAAAHAAAVKHFSSLGVAGIDAKAKDLPRLCFLSDDPDAYLNEEAIPIRPEPEAKSAAPVENRAAHSLPHPTQQETTEEAIRAALVTISPGIAYADWISIGMALHNWNAGRGEAIWEGWSAGSEKHKNGECATHWRSFNAKPGGVTIATLFHKARESGWTRTPAPGLRSAGPGGTPGTAADIRAALWTIAKTPGIDSIERNQRSAAAVVEWLHSRGKFFQNFARPDFTGCMYFDTVRKDLRNIQSDAFQACLSEQVGVNRGERLFALIQSAIETEALSSRSTAVEPATYWASRPDAVYISSGPGKMIRIRSGSVDEADNGTDGILFPVSDCLPAWKLTTPQSPFESCKVFSEMSASIEGKTLVALWVVALATNPRCKPPLCVSSQVGGGKTALIRAVFRILGIPDQINAVTKNGEGDFWAAMDGGGITCFDNADTTSDWLPDALASAATGGSYQKRKLYTDNQRVTLQPRAWIAITSASPSFAADPGLADRLLTVRLNRRTGQTSEAALYDEIDRQRDAALSFIAHTLAKALADRAPTPERLNQRHPDWAAMAVRIGRAMGKGEEAVRAIRSAEADKSLFNIENDSIGATLLEVMQSEPFDGTASGLLERMKLVDNSLDGKLSEKRLAKRLAKLWPHLEVVFQAKKEHGGHSKQNLYSLKPPKNAGIAGIGAAFSE